MPALCISCILVAVVSGLQSDPPASVADGGTHSERVVRGRLLDALTGEPVSGAECELWTEDFDEPMERIDVARSGPDGAYALRGGDGHGEKLRVRAEGYRSTVFSEEDVVFLFPRDEPFVLRVLDLDGSPVAGATVRSRQTCEHASPAVEGVTDADGRVTFVDAPPFEDGPEYEIGANGFGALADLHWSSFGVDPAVYLARRAPARLRLLDASGVPLANRRFRQQGSGHIAFTTDGDGRAVLESLYESREIGLTEAVKERPLHLFGWPPVEGECTLQPGTENMEGAPRPDWPVLAIGAQRNSTVHVQFGTDSFTFEAGRQRTDHRVPPGIPVVVLAQGEEIHRVALDPWEGTRNISLTDPETRIGPVPDVPREIALRFTTLSDDGVALATSAHLRWPGPQREYEDPSPDRALFHVPHGERWEVGFAADGHVRTFRSGRASDEKSYETVVLARMARVGFVGPCERVELAGQVRSADDGAGWREIDLAPGWAFGKLWHTAAGRPYALTLKLAPGERLVLDTKRPPQPHR